MGRIGWLTLVIFVLISCGKNSDKTDWDFFIKRNGSVSEKFQRIVQRGFQEYKKKNIKSCAALLQTPAVIKLNDGLIWFKLGRIYASTGKIPKALQCYSNAITVLPAQYAAHRYSWQVFINTGNLYFRSKEYKKALRSYQRTLLVNPSQKTAAFLAGKTAYLLNQFAAAASYLERAEQSSFKTQFYLSAVYMELKQWDKGFAAAKKAVVLKPESRQAAVNLGLFAINRGQKSYAAKEYRTAYRRFQLAEKLFKKALQFVNNEGDPKSSLKTRYSEYLRHIEMKLTVLKKKLAELK